MKWLVKIQFAYDAVIAGNQWRNGSKLMDCLCTSLPSECPSLLPLSSGLSVLLSQPKDVKHQDNTVLTACLKKRKRGHISVTCIQHQVFWVAGLSSRVFLLPDNSWNITQSSFRKKTHKNHAIHSIFYAIPFLPWFFTVKAKALQTQFLHVISQKLICLMFLKIPHYCLQEFGAGKPGKAARATRAALAVPIPHPFTRWYGCQCWGFWMCTYMLMHPPLVHRGCTNTCLHYKSALKVDCGIKVLL